MARTTQLQLRVTPEEKAQWKACAAREGLTLSQWIVKIALVEAHRTAPLAGKPFIEKVIKEHRAHVEAAIKKVVEVEAKKGVKRSSPLLNY